MAGNEQANSPTLRVGPERKRTLRGLTLVDPPTHRRVGLMVLPDQFSALDWAKRLLSQHQAAQDIAPLVGKGIVKAETTYPQLHLARRCLYVYVAWKGHIVFRHQGSAHDILHPQDIEDMDPVMAQHMVVGDKYWWVYAEPEQTHQWPIEGVAPPSTWGLRYGKLAVDSDQWTAPIWLLT